MLRIGAEDNEIKNGKWVEKINKTKSWFFGKIDKIDKPLVRLTWGREREKTQI